MTVTGIAYDSRRVKAGDLFVCWKGARHDGHHYAGDALARGAVAIVCERPLPDVAAPQIVVDDARLVMAHMAAAFYGHPSRRMRLIGVTGTNGKTTTSHLIKGVLEAAGFRVGLLGTIQYVVGDQVLEAPRTTPESVDLQALLARMAAGGITHCVMEVSSHAVALKRIAGCRFAAGVFTNISHDHLDFHPTFEDYLEAKADFFRQLDPADTTAVAIVNGDDPRAHRIAAACRVPVWRYGLVRRAEFGAQGVEVLPEGARFQARTPWGSFPVDLQLTGQFNVYNGLAAVAVGIWAGADRGAIRRGLASVRGVPGRFERVDVGQPFTVLVDYAHTPDSLENVLRAARSFTPGRLWVVFGCGGDRDPGKRPVMGAVAARLADRVVITSDNPRSEDPVAICRQVAEGARRAREAGEATARVRVVVERREAIREAIAGARPGDLVLIAGKGHETYQVFADRTVYFDDREEAATALRERMDREDRLR